MDKVALFSMLDCREKVIYSRHVHDYQEFTDSKGRYFMLDGGGEYLRYSVPDDSFEPKMVYDDEPIEFLREHILWGKNYDKDKNLLPKTEWVLLKDITDDHLDALLVYKGLNETYLNIFKREKQFRDERI